MNLQIDNELQDLIPPLSPDELKALDIEEIQRSVKDRGITPDNLVQGFRYEATALYPDYCAITLWPHTDATYWYCIVRNMEGEVFTKRPINKSAVHLIWKNESVLPKNTDWRVSLCEPSSKNPFDAPTAPRANGECFIYFVQGGECGLIKIGYAANPISRMEALQTGSPVLLRLIGVMKGSQADEKELHAKFVELRSHGEWFRPLPQLLTFISKITEENHAITN